MSENESNCLSMQKGCVVERICTNVYVLRFEYILSVSKSFVKSNSDSNSISVGLTWYINVTYM